MQPSRKGVSMTKLMAFDLDGTILFNRAVEPVSYTHLTLPTIYSV